MKKRFVINQSRKTIDMIAKKLGEDNKGSRIDIVNRICKHSYSAIKKTLED